VEVIVFDQNRLVALNGEDGKPTWTFAIPEGVRPGETGGGGAAVLANVDGTRGVLLTTPGPMPTLYLLDAKGKLRHSRKATKATSTIANSVFAHNLDGDGNDELIFRLDGKIRVARGGVTEQHELFTWPKSADGDDWEIVEIRPGKPATIIVRSPSRRVVHGLDGVKGVSIWRSQDTSSASVVLCPDDVTELPFLVTARSGQDTVARTSLPTDAEGRYRLLEPSVTPNETTVEDDPRFARMLPWASVQTTGIVLIPWLTLFTMGVGVILLPAYLLRQTWRRSWHWGFLLIPWAILLVLGLDYVMTRDVLRLRGTSTPQFLFLFFLLSLAGVGVMTPLYLLGRALWQRRWRRVFLLPMLFLVTTSLLAIVWVAVDSRELPRGGHYLENGSHRIALPGYLMTSAIVFLFLVALRSASGLRGLWRRFRRAG
jgi:hypothetical protein